MDRPRIINQPWPDEHQENMSYAKSLITGSAEELLAAEAETIRKQRHVAAMEFRMPSVRGWLQLAIRRQSFSTRAVQPHRLRKRPQ